MTSKGPGAPLTMALLALTLARFTVTPARVDNDSVHSDNGTVRVDNDVVHSDNGTVRIDNDVVHSDNGIARVDNDSVHCDNGTARVDTDLVHCDNGTARVSTGAIQRDKIPLALTQLAGHQVYCARVWNERIIGEGGKCRRCCEG